MSTHRSVSVQGLDAIASQRALVTFLAALSGYVAVLDADRRLVWASDDLVRFLGLPAADLVLGRRPGEALGCVHSWDSPLGCGASQACYQCGAVRSILDSKRLDRKVVHRASLERATPRGPRVLELEFTAAPWILDDRLYTVVTFH